MTDIVSTSQATDALPGPGAAFDGPDGSAGKALSRKNIEPGGATLDLLGNVPAEESGPASKLLALATSHLRSPHSRRAYRQAVREFIEWCTYSGAVELNKATVHEYIGELNRLRMSPATVNLALCAIRRLVSQLADDGLMSAESAAKILRIKGPRRKGVRLGNWLDVENAERLVRAPDMKTNKAKRDRALLAVLLGAGVRRSEVEQLSLAHIQRREDRWVIVDLVGKHNRVRSIPIPAWTKQAIDEWIAAADLRGGAIFRRVDKAGKVQEAAISVNAIYQIVRRYSAAIGVTIAPHDVRRTFAKLAHQGHASLDQIQLVLGHSSIVTTELYLGVQQNLRDAPCDHLGLKI